MSTDPNIDPTDPRLRTWDRPADRLRAAAETRYDKLRNNPALNADARQALIAQTWANLSSDMSNLSRQAGQTNAGDLARAKKAVHGIEDVMASASPAERASLAISFRDAQDRAAQTTSEAHQLALLDSADTSGDELLVRAVGSHALQQANVFGTTSAVADKYLEMRPKIADAYQRLQQMSQPTSTASMFEFVAPKPAELNGMTDATATTLAAGAARYGA